MIEVKRLFLGLFISMSFATAQEVSFIAKTAAGDVLCGSKKGSYELLQYKKLGSRKVLRFVASEISALAKKIRKARKLKQSKELRMLLKEQKRLTLAYTQKQSFCVLGPAPGASSNPLPGATPAATPPLFPPLVTPTPTPSGQAVFDALGSVTQYGKAILAIPVGLSANQTVGKDVNARLCVGCHIERTNKTFAELRSLTTKAPMFFDSTNLSDIDLANLTAYLNRFR